MEPRTRHQQYWKANISLVAVLLVIWSLPSLGCGILFVDALDRFRIGGFPLGFWFAQQGSIVVFVLLILVYALVMDRYDRKFQDDPPAKGDAS